MTRDPSALSIACTAWCAMMLLVLLARCDATASAQETTEPGRSSAGAATTANGGEHAERAPSKPSDDSVRLATILIEVDPMLLAKAFVAEADLEAEIDHRAIAHALARGAAARGVSLDQHIRDYVSALKPSHKPTPRTRWILELDETGARPPSFPPNLTWETCRGKRCVSRRDLWLAAIQRARNFAWGLLPDPCGASHWGARDIPIDVERADRAIKAGKWIPARCAGARTANAFYTTRAR